MQIPEDLLYNDEHEWIQRKDGSVVRIGISDYAMELWPDGQHAAIAIPDARKGEQIVLLTDVEEVSRSALMAAARRAGASELNIPKQIVYREAIPLLGSGKVDYLAIKDLVSKYAKKPDDAEEA